MDTDNLYRHFGEHTIFINCDKHLDILCKTKGLKSAGMILEHLICKMDKDNNAQCTRDELQEITHCKSPTVVKAVKALKELNAIEEIDKDIYHVSKELAFK